MPKPDDDSGGRSPSQPRIRAANRVRGGRRFEPIQEKRLLPTARRVLGEIAAENSVLALKEFHAPFGVPDITAVIGEPAIRRVRLRSGIPPLLNEIDAAIVATASTNVVLSSRQIAHRLRWAHPSIDRRLPHVVKAGGLFRVREDRYIRHPALVPLGTIVAIETKIRKWRRALQQCRTYTLWADSYILVIDEVSNGSLDELKAEVRRDRGGLVVGGETLLEPSAGKLKASRRLWSSEHVVAELRAERAL